ncbi:helix-turn-helix domain-containing protein [Nocardia nova]|jgi:transcriptional regulator with XRE-family HTH domain|uniref:helix-turn-helix domain-containing protein n=1 Tax=Nocardia nova TaxID=37330 RepID=UPI001894E004|nr:helix-turn-helix transcriptional regulator [Nocardia nova]MBF6149479.1 helix-turn-helix domain-containing protein [Nocardia nova]MDN2498442.1 helix-turn-helix domain-containing protein [Nocardia nova]
MMAESVRIGRVDSLVAERGPTALRIAVGGQLRKLREAAGITREAAGEHIRGSHAKISRLELGRTGFKERDVRDLLTLYGVDNAEEREMFLDLVSRANQPGWWHSYNDLLPQWFETYLGLEHASKSIRTFEGQLVPGLLQTEEYTRSVVALGHENAEAARRVELRKKRQEILDRPGAPTLWAVLDEAVLHRPIGGEQVLRAQLEHLVEVSMKPNVTIQVLPYAAGGHAAAGSSFTMLRFAEPELPDIVYLEQLTSALYLDRQQDLELYRQVMDRLSVQAEPPERSREMMQKAAGGLSDSA